MNTKQIEVIIGAENDNRLQVIGNKVIKKLVYHDGAYYFGAYVPPWNSKLFKHFVIDKLNTFKPSNVKSNRFNNIFFAITKKCPLQCAHCFEWDELNKKEVLGLDKIFEILIFNNKIKIT